MGEDLDAVALGLKRGRRGAVTVVALVSLVLLVVVVAPSRSEEPPDALTPPVVDEVVAPVPVPKKAVATKRSRATRAAPRNVPETLQPSAVVPPPALNAESPVVVAPRALDAAAPVVAAPALNAESLVVAALDADSPVVVAPRAPEVEPVVVAASQLASDRAVDATGAVTLAPPPTPPAEELDAPDGNGEAIARAIAAAKRAAVRECFERELKQTPKLQGTVVVELDLAPPNKVSDVRVSDDLERPAFTRCVVETMRDVRFAALDEEVSVRVPYALTPGRK